MVSYLYADTVHDMSTLSMVSFTNMIKTSIKLSIVEYARYLIITWLLPSLTFLC